VVVGADGLDSMVARRVGAGTYEQAETMCCIYYTYWAGLPADYEVFVDQQRLVGVVPTNDELTLVCVQWRRSEFDRVRRDVERSYFAAIEGTAAGIAERLREAQRAERFTGTGRLPNFFRTSAGPGWALVGDAGYHKDPIGANGISDAIAHAELLAGHLDRGLRGESDLDDAVTRYAAERDRRALPHYYFNLRAATLEPAPELLDVLRAIRDEPEQVSRFFGMIAGLSTWEEFVAGFPAFR
jgi:flavin-dependent dehydrogenase